MIFFFIFSYSSSVIKFSFRRILSMLSSILYRNNFSFSINITWHSHSAYFFASFSGGNRNVSKYFSKTSQFTNTAFPTLYTAPASLARISNVFRHRPYISAPSLYLTKTGFRGSTFAISSPLYSLWPLYLPIKTYRHSDISLSTDNIIKAIQVADQFSAHIGLAPSFSDRISPEVSLSQTCFMASVQLLYFFGQIFLAPYLSFNVKNAFLRYHPVSNRAGISWRIFLAAPHILTSCVPSIRLSMFSCQIPWHFWINLQGLSPRKTYKIISEMKLYAL